VQLAEIYTRWNTLDQNFDLAQPFDRTPTALQRVSGAWGRVGRYFTNDESFDLENFCLNGFPLWVTSTFVARDSLIAHVNCTPVGGAEQRIAALRTNMTINEELAIAQRFDEYLAAGVVTGPSRVFFGWVVSTTYRVPKGTDPIFTSEYPHRATLRSVDIHFHSCARPSDHGRHGGTIA
jgi:hypothetical protein